MQNAGLSAHCTIGVSENKKKSGQKEKKAKRDYEYREGKRSNEFEKLKCTG